ncbi:type II toxin-antitoxin system RelE/ParE family toxin [Candidatus Woesearchaeota archaeon]|nr:type II toxin-antitoxin system RelE/ParE family toxin [Candidatus Woesearchaeota archaeon]
MVYGFIVNEKCQKEIGKHSKKNRVLEEAIKSKMKEILEHPEHYKPLQHDLAGERRVHILKSFVLKFTVDEVNKTVIFLFFSHHDEAYRR